MGCTPSVLVENKHRDSNSTSNGSTAVGNSGVGSGVAGNHGTVPGTGIAPRASLDSDCLGPPSKRESVVNHIGGGLFHTTATTFGLKTKRLSGGEHTSKLWKKLIRIKHDKCSTGSCPSGRLGHRKSSLALTPEDEPLETPPKKSCDSTYGMLIPPSTKTLKLLLVFEGDDSVRQALVAGARRIGFNTSVAESATEALELYNQHMHDLVFIDVRNQTTDFDPEKLCRSLRNYKGSQHSVIIATVKSCLFENEGVTILPLLDAGFNRFWVESSNHNLCSNELLQLMYSDVRPQAQIATAQALYRALDKCRDLVHITDERHCIQYVNKASQAVLGYRQEELIGKSLIEPTDDISMLTSYVSRNKEWEGPITAHRKQGDAITLHSKVIPVSNDGRTPNHVVFVQDPPGHGLLSHDVLSPTPVIQPYRDAVPRGSLSSLRRGSGFDVRSIGSDGLRKSSIAKLQSMPLEAPITKVIMLVNQIQEMCGPDVARQLDRVQDLLRQSDMYSPFIKDSRTRSMSEDPVTTDLIGALLQQGPTHILSSRRSSNDSTSVRAVAAGRISSGKQLMIPPAKIRELLETSLKWDFDIFRLEELSDHRPLVHLGMKIMCHYNVPDTLNCDEKILENWLKVVEGKYRSSNSYHTSTHAADVLQAIAVFMTKDRLNSLLDPIDIATALIAGAAHDIDHPGKSSAFLCNINDELAILYNDVCVLESHHAACTFQLTFKDDRVNIFKNLDSETYKLARHNIIDMILATEMTKHFEHLTKFINVFCNPNTREEFSDVTMDAPPENPLTLPDNLTLVKRMMIKCADVANPARPIAQCVEWARRIAEEYFMQTDEETSRGLPIVMPMFNRSECSIPKSQIGFMDFIIHGMMEAWDAFTDMPEAITNMNYNFLKWQEFDAQGVSTSEDLKQFLLSLKLEKKSSLK